MSWHPFLDRWVFIPLLHFNHWKNSEIYTFMHADVCWNGFQFGTARCWHLWFTSIYIYIYIVYVYLTNCFYIHFVFTLFCAHNWFVFDANFNSPNNQDGLFFKYKIILIGCLHVLINSIKTRVTRKSIVLEFKIARDTCTV